MQVRVNVQTDEKKTLNLRKLQVDLPILFT